MGVRRWFADRRPDAVSHGLPGRAVYTALALLVGLEVFSMASALGALLAVVVTGFAAVFVGIPFLVKVWSPSAMVKKREISQRERIDPQPPPRDPQAPKRW